jgi:hypothetical protein
MIPEGFIFSQSSLQSFLNCPRQFDLTYLRKLAWPAQKYADTEKYQLDLAAGQALHQAIQRFLLGFDALLILERLQSGNDPRLPIWFTNFSSRFGYLKEKTNFIAEVPISIPFEPYWLTAKFDYLCLENGKVAIFDWKTSARKPPKSLLEESLQTKVYLTVACEADLRLSMISPSIRYWEANFPDLELVFQPDEVALQHIANELHELIHVITVEKEFPKTNELVRCVYCKYRSYCNRGGIPGETSSDEAFDITVREGIEDISDES